MRRLFAILALVLGASAADAAPLEGRWRVIRAEVAPWAKGPAPAPAFHRAGLVFRPDGLMGPAPLSCPGARQEAIAVAHGGLFEGASPPEKAEALARDLGLSRTGPVPTVRVTCANASFDFHRSGPDRILFAVDQVIYTARPAAFEDPRPDAAFVEPAFPALDCVLAGEGWQRIVCDSPEASAAHATLSRETALIADNAGAHRAFLAAAARRCGARAKGTAAGNAETAACLAQAYGDRLIALREAAGR
jgi:hypothetical protein